MTHLIIGIAARVLIFGFCLALGAAPINTHVGHHGGLQGGPRFEDHLIKWCDIPEIGGSSMPLVSIPCMVSPYMPPARLEMKPLTYEQIAPRGPGSSSGDASAVPEPGALGVMSILLLAAVQWRQRGRA